MKLTSLEANHENVLEVVAEGLDIGVEEEPSVVEVEEREEEEVAHEEGDLGKGLEALVEAGHDREGRGGGDDDDDADLQARQVITSGPCLVLPRDEALINTTAHFRSGGKLSRKNDHEWRHAS